MKTNLLIETRTFAPGEPNPHIISQQYPAISPAGRTDIISQSMANAKAAGFEQVNYRIEDIDNETTCVRWDNVKKKTAKMGKDRRCPDITAVAKEWVEGFGYYDGEPSPTTSKILLLAVFNEGRIHERMLQSVVIEVAQDNMVTLLQFLTHAYAQHGYNAHCNVTIEPSCDGHQVCVNASISTRV